MPARSPWASGSSGAGASLIIRFRRARGDERLQLKWFAFAAVVVLVAELVVPAVGVAVTGGVDQALISVMEAFAVPWLAVAAGVAVLRYRLYDIDPLINRTLVYGGLTAAVVALYILVVGYFGTILDLRGEPVSLLAAGIVAVAFQPLRDRLQRGVNRLQRGVNRLLYGQRDEPYAVLSGLGQRLEASLHPHEVLPTIVQTVRDALKLPYAAIELFADEGRFVAAVSGTPQDSALRLPLTFRSQPVGVLVLAPRARSEVFTPADRALLDDFAGQAGVAAHAVRLTTELQRARERLVVTRKDERRRLRRDLHDGLGPALASQTLTLDAARKLLRDDPDAADALLVDLRERARAGVADIRRLVYDLRPPALDERGLLAAISEHVERVQRTGLEIAFEHPATLPPLSAASEVATYRIVSEALTNVTRHAEADTCMVRFIVAGDGTAQRLDLKVRDDGRGLPVGYRPGVGMLSMRERATELGGHCLIESTVDGGVRVHATLPLLATSS